MRGLQITATALSFVACGIAVAFYPPAISLLLGLIASMTFSSVVWTLTRQPVNFGAVIGSGLAMFVLIAIEMPSPAALGFNLGFAISWLIGLSSASRNS